MKKLSETNQRQLEKYGCILLGILAWPLVFYWLLGMILAIVSIIAGILFLKNNEICTEIKIGFIFSGIYLGTGLLYWIFYSIYFSLVHIQVK